MRAPTFRWTSVALASLYVLLALAMAECGSSPSAPTATNSVAPPATTSVPAFSLAGGWVRVDSSFTSLDGMIVQVNDAESEGVITSAPANIYRFAAGDVKWRNVRKRSATEYDFEDLVRRANTGRQSYVGGIIEVQSSGQELRLRFPTTGTFQEWRKP